MKQTLKSLPLDDRPREKLMEKGVSALSNAELLAILFNNGTREQTAVQVAQQLLQSAGGNLNLLATKSVPEILQYKVKGIGPAKAIIIAAAMELGRRKEVEDRKLEYVASPSAAAAYFQARFRHLTEELFAVIFLSRSNKVNHIEIVSNGGHSSTIVDIQVVLKKALAHNASKLILCHNHPGGGLRPSPFDEKITLSLREAARLFHIEIIDHIIVSDGGFFSFSDSGLL